VDDSGLCEGSDRRNRIKESITYCPLPQDDPVKRKPDISKAKRLFGWKSKIDLETGLKLSLEYFQSFVEVLPGAAREHYARGKLCRRREMEGRGSTPLSAHRC
jgi:hypothetical protein